ncbi:MAG: curli assembly protein CsgG [Leptospira sp.]|nr:curli assembly protein CsgG [Leptospira sp.]
MSTSLSEGAFTVRKVAVLKFEVSGGEEWEEDFTGAFMHHLMSNTKWQIIERQHLNKIFQEQKFSASGAVDQETAQKIGKILGVDTIILGYGSASNYTNKKGDLIPELVERFSIRVINVANGAIVIKARKTPGIDWTPGNVAKLILGLGLIWSKDDLYRTSNVYDNVAKKMAKDVGKGLMKMDKVAR